MNDSNSKFSKTKEFALDLLFPKFCLGCQKEGTYLCDDCRALLDIAEFDYCLCETKPQRLLPDQKNGETPRQAQGKCSKCSKKELSGLYSALSYKEKPLTKKLIRQFKYPPYLKDLSKTLASILIEHFVISGKNTDDIWENSVLIPVPLDKKKLRTRGYNQSEELAKELSKVLQIPVISDVLIKIKSTKPQMELKKEEREKNLQNAFALSEAKPYTEVKNFVKSDLTKFSCRHCEEDSSPTKQSLSEAKPYTEDLASKMTESKVFLVDDVYTTGSTMQECAKVLCSAGAKSVWGITIAREG
jgi:predicted amidophosphoribosyltransferase